MGREISEINNLYLLRNNSFLKHEANLSNSEYKILNLTMAKLQKQLLDDYPKWDRKTVEQMPPAMECRLHIDELKQLNIRENDLLGKNLVSLLDGLANTKVRFINYLTGGYVASRLLSEFEIDKETGDITTQMTKRVFLFLLDYKGSFDYAKNFPNDDDVKKIKRVRKRTIPKGYMKLNVLTTVGIKSYYSQILYNNFKTEFEKINNKSREKINFDITFFVDDLRRIMGTTFIDKDDVEKIKYKKYTAFKSNVIDRAIEELEEKRYFKTTYTENMKTAKGGMKVDSITFNVEYLGRLDETDSYKYRKKSKDKVDFVDAEYEEISKKSSSKAITLAEILSNKLIEEANKYIAVKTMQNFIDTYKEDKVKRAVNSLILKCEKESVMVPEKYLSKAMEDMCDREAGTNNIKNDKLVDVDKTKGNYTSNNSKRVGKNQSNVRTDEEYKKMEDELTSWYMD